MKKRLLLAGVIFIAIAAIMAVFYNFTLSPQGTTTESRAEILNTTISAGTNWTIATETVIEGHIISAAYSTDNKVSLAIFKPAENGGYEFQTSTNRYADEIIISNVVINQNTYDLVWFNGAQTEYAELIYTVGNQPQETLRFNTNDMSIICVESPAKEYTLWAAYYDHDGNKYK